MLYDNDVASSKKNVVYVVVVVVVVATVIVIHSLCCYRANFFCVACTMMGLGETNFIKKSNVDLSLT